MALAKRSADQTPEARVRELERFLALDRTDVVERQNALEEYLDFDPSLRRLVVVPSSDQVREIRKRCSPMDARDASQVAQAEQQRQIYSRRFPCLFAEAGRQPERVQPAFSFDEMAARDALAACLAVIGKANRDTAALLQRQSAVDTAAARESMAQQTLGAITADEGRAWTAWLSNQAIAKPQPRTADRAAALIELQDSKAQHAAAKEAAAAIYPEYVAANQSLARLVEQRRPLIAAVVAHALPKLIAERQEIEDALAAATGAIAKLRSVLNQEGGGTASVDVALQIDRDARRRRLLDLAAASGQRVADWADELAQDASAELVDA
jgi:hypothetical protein